MWFYYKLLFLYGVWRYNYRATTVKPMNLLEIIFEFLELNKFRFESTSIFLVTNIYSPWILFRCLRDQCVDCIEWVQSYWCFIFKILKSCYSVNALFILGTRVCYQSFDIYIQTLFCIWFIWKGFTVKLLDALYFEWLHPPSKWSLG